MTSHSNITLQIAVILNRLSDIMDEVESIRESVVEIAKELDED